MDRPITRLLPDPHQDVPLTGLYLDPQLHRDADNDRPFVYTNFITSLDGRIAVALDDSATHQVPPAIANKRDWRLYQELAGHADILVTSGRFYRQSAQGEAQDRLPVGAEEAYADIRRWRTDQGLKAQPDIAIMSGSLDIPVASLEPYQGRDLYVFTGAAADPGRARALEQAGAQVIRAGDDRRVDGRRMIDHLATAGFRSVYAIAGPAVFNTLLSAAVIDRVYLTIACTLLGGNDFNTLVEGSALTPAAGMRAVGLHHDSHAPAGGQLFGVFEPA